MLGLLSQKVIRIKRYTLWCVYHGSFLDGKFCGGFGRKSNLSKQKEVSFCLPRTGERESIRPAGRILYL